MNDRIADLYRRLDELGHVVEELQTAAQSNPDELKACFDERDEGDFLNQIIPALAWNLKQSAASILGSVTPDVARLMG